MSNLRRSFPGNLLFSLLCVITVTYIYFGKISGDDARISGSGLPPDALQFIANSQQYFSPTSQRSSSNIAASTLREPAFPLLLNLGFTWHVNPSATDYHCLTTNGDDCKRVRIQIKRLMAIVMILLGLSAAYIAWQLTQSKVIGYIGLLLSSSSESLWLSSAQLLSEPLSALLLLWTCYFFYLASIRNQLRYALALGISAALLSLTKVVFLTLLVLFPFCLLMIHYKSNQRRWHILSSLLPTVAVFSALIVGWQAYLQHKDIASPGNRGASVLTARANYNQMSGQEYFASFVYWSSSAGKKAAERLLPVAAYTKLDRENPNGYFRTGDSLRSQQGESPAMAIIKSPIKHLLVSIPIFYRGLFVETGFSGGRDFLLSIKLSSAVLIGPLLFLGFFVCCIHLFRHKFWQPLLFAVPVIYSIGVHSLITHNIPRYGYPLIPILILFSLWYFAIKVKPAILSAPQKN